MAFYFSFPDCNTENEKSLDEYSNLTAKSFRNKEKIDRKQ